MDTIIDINELISVELLDELIEHLLKLYDLAEQSTLLEYHDNYTFSCCLYRQSLNANSECFKNSKLVEDHSKNNKSILKVIGSPLYLRFLTTNPAEHKRKHGTDIIEMFNLSEDCQYHPDLFRDNNEKEEKLFGFFYYDKTPDDIAYLKLQVFDKFWNVRSEWSSDTIQSHKILNFDESSTELPEPRLLNGEQLTPIDSIHAYKKKGS